MKHLLLAGAGHAHLFVLRALARQPIPGVEVTLVTPDPHAPYSGMIPGYLRGTYAESDLAFDVKALAAAAGATLVFGSIARVRQAARVAELDDSNRELHFDVASLDVGSVASGLEIPGVLEHAVPVRPLARAIGLRGRADALRADSSIVIAGGGPGGLEVAFALEARGRERGARPRVTLVERAPELLAAFAPRVRRLAARALERAGIRLVLGSSVTQVEKERVVLDDGASFESGLTPWLAGAGAPPVIVASRLPKDAKGFFAVDDTLRSVDGAPVFGGGDCIGIAGHPDLPKAGVFAVREGPLLAANLRAALEGRTLKRFSPQRSYLMLLNTADGRAILRWHSLALHSRSAWHLKDRIDRGFIRAMSPTGVPHGP